MSLGLATRIASSIKCLGLGTLNVPAALIAPGYTSGNALKASARSISIWGNNTALLKKSCLSKDGEGTLNFGSSCRMLHGGNLPSPILKPASFTPMLLSPEQSNTMNNLTSHPLPFPLMDVSRTLVKFSLKKGRRKTVNAIKNRFYRLDWGGWISTIPGRARHLWKKSAQKRYFMKNHVFRKASEVRLLEKMVSKYWVKKKHFVNDPYESYHKRDSFRISKGVQGVDSALLYYKPRRYTGYYNRKDRNIR